MDYDKYLKLQSFLERFYEFHPQFFDDIPSRTSKTLITFGRFMFLFGVGVSYVFAR